MSGLPITGDHALLAAIAFLAGLVRGFSGFGTALIYMPLASQILSPFAAIATMAIFDLVGPLPNVPRALREGQIRDVLRLAAGLIITLPVGLWMLTQVPPEAFRYTVSIVVLGMLVCLMAGLRYRGPLTPSLIYGTGGLAGLLHGVAGIPGPPVILLYMASTAAARLVRANTLLFLLFCDLAMLPALLVFDRLDTGTVVLGMALIAPNLAGNMLGAWVFRPGWTRLYRAVAYGLIALSAVLGLPFWG